MLKEEFEYTKCEKIWTYFLCAILGIGTGILFTMPPSEAVWYYIVGYVIFVIYCINYFNTTKVFEKMRKKRIYENEVFKEKARREVKKKYKKPIT